MKIQLPKGCHCLDVSAVSSAPSPEEEILLPANGHFRITRYSIDKTFGIMEAEAVYEP